jgi:hypothetical protein
MHSIIYFSVLIAVCYANEIRLHNNCPFTVWPGIQGNPGHGQPEGGGFALASQQTHVLNVASNWAGRFWGRTECGANGHCVTGDCGNKIQCNGAGGVPPVSLAEITFAGAGGLDFYDVSLVDGYNLPVSMVPTGGFKKTGGNHYDCGRAGCNSDLNAHCPAELAVHSGSATVACLSACAKFNTDEYCCRGAHDKPQTCKSNTWPKNYPAIFKQACPDAYSYAYDDTSSTFTCHGDPHANYEIVFCP